MALRLGVDVGGTNTDAALLSPSSEVLATAKSTTTPDIVTGIENSIRCLQDHVPNLQGMHFRQACQLVHSISFSC